jgi:hypothetical protein
MLESAADEMELLGAVGVGHVAENCLGFKVCGTKGALPKSSEVLNPKIKIISVLYN